METIHIKTIDPISQKLLQSAASKGLELGWERYEKLQPQDGFLRLGLSCPFGCMQGPCRIDPFERGAMQGICGLDRDGMVAAMLLRLCLNGALEALNEVSVDGESFQPTWPKSLKAVVAKKLETLGGGDLSIKEIYHCAALLQCPGVSPEDLVRNSLRLGILTLALTSENKTKTKNKETLSLQAGYGLFNEDSIVIGIYGKVATTVLNELSMASEASESNVKLVSLGEWIPSKDGYLPIGCSSGEAELLLSSGRIDLLLCDSGTEFSITEICEKLQIPIVQSASFPAINDIVQLAIKSHHSSGSENFFSDASSVEDAEVIMTSKRVKTEFSAEKEIALIGGSDVPQQSLGWISTEVAPALSGIGFQLGCWGDTALWITKRGLTGGGDQNPIRLLNPVQGPLNVLEMAFESGASEKIKGICYTGLKTCQDLASAIGFSSIGTRVSVASPLPLWGSVHVRELLAELIKSQGGTFSHFDQPADANMILQWFRD